MADNPLEDDATEVENDAKELAGKDDMPGEVVHYSPLGGATSFAEVDAYDETWEYQERINKLFHTFQVLQNNIMADATLTPSQKASAMTQGSRELQRRLVEAETKERREAEKAGRRMNNNKLGLLDKLITQLKDFLSWASYDEEGEREKSIAKVGFKVFRDKDGELRWLSYSSNAYEDLDKELFTTKALEEAVGYADKSGERGPLLIYHVPTAVIGACDYQGMAGRFLVESGTFDYTPMGRKAVEYFESGDREHQVSIGYQYQSGDEKDGQYDWLRIMERSITPVGKAANPWTQFSITGGKALDEEKAKELERILGGELAGQVIAAAENQTKELDGSVRYKTIDTVIDDAEKAPKDMKAALSGLAGMLKDIENPAIRGKFSELIEAARELTSAKSDKGLTEDIASAETADVTGEPDSASGSVSAEIDRVGSAAAFVAVANAVTEMAGQMGALSDRVGALDKEVKEAKAAYEGSPRYQPGSKTRPSESDKNIVGDDIKSKLDGSEEDQPVNPVADYIKQLGVAARY